MLKKVGEWFASGLVGQFISIVFSGVFAGVLAILGKMHRNFDPWFLWVSSVFSGLFALILYRCSQILYMFYIERKNKAEIELQKAESELEKEKREHESAIRIKEKENDFQTTIVDKENDFQTTIVDKIYDAIKNPGLNKEDEDKQIKFLFNQLSEERKERLKPFMVKYYNKQSEYEPEVYTKFEILFGYFVKNITDKKRKLIETLMKKVDKISTRAIWFLLALDDNEIEILKKQFCYVGNGAGILYYNNIEQEFYKKGLNVKRITDRLKFMNEIWQYGDSGIGFRLPPETNQARVVAIFKERVILEHSNTNKELMIKTLCHLTELGQELYSLFKEEIEEVPNNYIAKLMEHLHQNHKGHQFKIVENTNEALRPYF